MKQTITESMFIDAFKHHSRADNFSYNGLKAMFEFFERLDEDCGTETELDVIAICCEFTEYENLAEFHENYSPDEYQDMEDISNSTTIIDIDGEAFIIQDF